MSLGVNAKHVSDKFASFDLILRNIQYVTSSRLGFYRQKNTGVVVYSNNVWKPSATPSKAAGLPVSSIQSLNECVLVIVAATSPDVPQAVSKSAVVPLKFLCE